MINIPSFLIGLIFGGIGTLILLSYAITPPEVDEEVSNEEIEKELEIDNKKG